MPSFLRHKSVVRWSQILIGLLMLTAALAKLGNLSVFAQQIHNFRLAPVAVENLIAMTVPWIELVAGMALVLGVRARAGAILTFSMLALFTLAVVQAVARGLDFECGCFGTADGTRVGLWKILQNLGMLALAFVGSIRPSSS